MQHQYGIDTPIGVNDTDRANRYHAHIIFRPASYENRDKYTEINMSVYFRVPTRGSGSVPNFSEMNIAFRDEGEQMRRDTGIDLIGSPESTKGDPFLVWIKRAISAKLKEYEKPEVKWEFEMTENSTANSILIPNYLANTIAQVLVKTFKPSAFPKDTGLCVFFDGYYQTFDQLKKALMKTAKNIDKLDLYNLRGNILGSDFGIAESRKTIRFSDWK